MIDKPSFGEDEQSDLLSAAVRLYEAGVYGLCMSILDVLMSCKNKEAYILAGHCVVENEYEDSKELARQYYGVACNLGSSVGCYNLHLSYLNENEIMAETYLQRAKLLGWED